MSDLTFSVFMTAVFATLAILGWNAMPHGAGLILMIVCGLATIVFAFLTVWGFTEWATGEMERWDQFSALAERIGCYPPPVPPVPPEEQEYPIP